MSDSRVLIAVAAGAGLLVGYAVSGWLQGFPLHRPAAEAGGADRAGSVQAEIASLRAALDEERGRRGALEMEMEMLRQEMAREAAPGDEPPAAALGAREPEAAEGEGAPESAAAAHAAPGGKEWFDEADLVERGVDERRTAWLRERFELLQMDELYLRDEAFRQGWLGKPRFHAQLQKLRAAARQELGDEDYDWLLYGSGRDNRVRLTDVLQNSPAGDAGIEPGDYIESYDGQRIFSPTELIGATRKRELGSTVPVDVLRGGERRRVYVKSGPLGVRIQPARVFPGSEH